MTGLLCVAKNTDSLYEQMQRMTLMSREKREAMGMAARAKIEREFEKSLVVQKTKQARFGA